MKLTTTSENKFAIPVSNYNAGIYLLMIKNENGKATEAKFIKE